LLLSRRVDLPERVLLLVVTVSLLTSSSKVFECEAPSPALKVPALASAGVWVFFPSMVGPFPFSFPHYYRLTQIFSRSAWGSFFSSTNPSLRPFLCCVLFSVFFLPPYFENYQIYVFRITRLSPKHFFLRRIFPPPLPFSRQNLSIPQALDLWQFSSRLKNFSFFLVNIGALDDPPPFHFPLFSETRNSFVLSARKRRLFPVLPDG